jgi:hypothetical protein
MIISHKFQFIFVKTAKTAGTSIEMYLSSICGPNDIFTPFSLTEKNHVPRNFQGWFNPIPELIIKTKFNRGVRDANLKLTIRDFLSKRKFFHHIPAWQIRERINRRIWDGYYKFCVERNPWDKVVSGWYWYNQKYNNPISLDKYIVILEKRIQERRSGVGVYPYNYFNYVDPMSEKLLTDRIIYYENLDEELKSIFKLLGITIGTSLGIHAKSGYRGDKGRYRDTINNRHRDIIGKLFYQEIKLHGYSY